MADEDDMDAEMEKRIFDMQDIDKMENFVDNQVLKGVRIPEKKEKENKAKSKKEYTDKIKKQINKNLFLLIFYNFIYHKINIINLHQPKIF